MGLEGWFGGDCIRSVKRRGMKKKGGETKILKRDVLGKGVCALKGETMDHLMNYAYSVL